MAEDLQLPSGQVVGRRATAPILPIINLKSGAAGGHRVLGGVGGLAAASDPPDLGAARGHPLIRHQFKRMGASMTAAICYGSRGGGLGLQKGLAELRGWEETFRVAEECCGERCWH